MTTYAEYQEQIKELQKKAEEKRKEELHGVIDEIKDKIKVYGITAKDLGFSDSLISEIKSKPTKSSEPLPPKYRSTDGTKEWHGKGRYPEWVKEEISSGKKLFDLLIEKP